MRWLFVSLALWCVLFCPPAFSQEPEEEYRTTERQEENSLRIGVKGFVDTYHALRTEKPNDWMSSRTRMRGELTLEKGHVGAFVSANVMHNAVLSGRTGFQLREAYAYYASPHWDIRAGRQIITWGVADAVRLTDIISPMDYTEFLAQDYDDIRIPAGGLRIRYSRQKWSLEAVAIPVSSFYDLPLDEKNPWAVNLPSVSVPYEIRIGEEPSRRLANMEYGGRLVFFLSGIDFSFSALHTWNKMPVFLKTMNNGVLSCLGTYRRMTMLGADVSLPLGRFVVRGELAEYFDEVQEPVAGAVVPRSSSFNSLIGIDWYPGNDWTLSAQYAHKCIGGHQPSVSAYRNTGLSTLRVSKDMLRSTLTLSTFAYVDVTNGGVYNRLSADYALNDQLHVFLGYDYFHAHSGMFAMYDKNSELWVRLKYNF